MTVEDADKIKRAEEIQRYTENRCEALEKENAELKEKWLRATDWGTSYANLKSLENENAKLKEQNEKLLESCAGTTLMYEHLTRAKELLKWVVQYFNFKEFRSNLAPYKDKITEVKQFLEELEGNYCENKKVRTYEETLKPVKEGAIDLTQQECFSTAAKLDERYHSLHEGYAILLEKVEDIKQQFDMLYGTGLPILWESTKTEDFDCAMLQLKAMLVNVQSLVEEAALAGVVIQNIQNTLDGTKLPKDEQ